MAAGGMMDLVRELVKLPKDDPLRKLGEKFVSVELEKERRREHLANWEAREVGVMK